MIDLIENKDNPERIKESIKSAMDNIAMHVLDEVRREIAQDLLQIDELSKSTLGSYVSKAASDIDHHAQKIPKHQAAQDRANRAVKNKDLAFAKSANQAIAKHHAGAEAEHMHKKKQRVGGITKAISRLVK